jgi:glycerate kinase
MELMNILIAPNSFKECADSVTVSNLFNQFLSPYYNTIRKPISDGGDGFLEVCNFYFNLELIEYEISTPFDDSIIKCYAGLDRINKTLHVESADVLGLKVIPKEKRHPLLLSSKGLGDLMISVEKDIEGKKYDVNKLILGIGGTGTMDMGLGACSRFGMKLSDIFGKQMEIIPGNFHKTGSIDWTKPDLPFELELIVDVDNPLIGQDGASRIFGKQKGSTGGEIEVIELGFNKLINLFQNKGLLNSINNLSGAGGGVPAGLEIFFGCSIKNAEYFIKDYLGFQKLSGNIDAVITGEGSFDAQSFSGKGAGIILDIFIDKKIPVFLCCGKIDGSIQFDSNVHPIELAKYFSNSAEAIEKFEDSIKYACEEISEKLQP